MRIVLLLLTAVLAIFVAASGTAPAPFSTGPASAAALPENGGFENGLAGWTVPSWFSNVVQADSAESHTGAASLRFQGKATSPYIYQDIPTSPGSVLTFTGYARLPQVGGRTEVVVEVIARHQYNGDLQTFPLAVTRDTGGDWVMVSGSATMPARTAVARLRIRCSTLDGTAYLDDLALEIGGSAATGTPTATAGSASPTATATATATSQTPYYTSTPTPTATATSPSTSATATVTPTGPARIVVNPAVAVATVGDILGAVINEEYTSPDDGRLGRTIDSIRSLDLVSGRKFAVRFGHTVTDGLSGGDGYHWRAAFDSPSTSTTIAEFMDYVSRVDGEPYVVVNFGSGTAAEAAGLVAYANGTDSSNEFVQLRIQQGHPAPYNIRNWIIGNELYAYYETGNQATRRYDYANPYAWNGGDPAWYNRPANNRAYFAARAVEYAQRMRAASPTAVKIHVPLNDWDFRNWGGADSSAATIVAQAGPYVDGFVVHYYPADSRYGEADVDLMGETEILARNLDTLRSLLLKYGPAGKNLEIADIEFNNRSPSNPQTRQLVSGLFAADSLRVMATKGVSSAYYFAISVPPGGLSAYSFFEAGDLTKPTPAYLATQLLARNLGSQVVSSELSGARLNKTRGGAKGPTYFPALTSLASLSPDRKTLYLVVINKDLTTGQSAEINLGGAKPASTCQVTILNGPYIWSTAPDVKLQESQVATSSLSTWDFPAHSVTAFRIPLTAPVP